MSISGLFALRYPPPIPCLLLCFHSPEGREHPLPVPGRLSTLIRYPTPSYLQGNIRISQGPGFTLARELTGYVMISSIGNICLPCRIVRIDT